MVSLEQHACICIYIHASGQILGKIYETFEKNVNHTAPMLMFLIQKIEDWIVFCFYLIRGTGMLINFFLLSNI